MLTLVGALAVAVPVAWASDVFADVDTSNPFHNDINAIKTAGITQGCGTNASGQPIYCPLDNVTRQAMAAFLHRGFGRTGQTNFGVAWPATGEAVVATRAITPGAVAPGTGFIKADAQVTVYVSSSTANGCPCTVYAFLRRADTGAFVGNIAYASLTSPIFGSPGFIQTLNLTGVVPSGSNPVAVQLVAGRYSGTGTVNTFGTVTASYFPFGPTGTNAASGAGASTATPLPAPGH